MRCTRLASWAPCRTTLIDQKKAKNYVKELQNSFKNNAWYSKRWKLESFTMSASKNKRLKIWLKASSYPILQSSCKRFLSSNSSITTLTRDNPCQPAEGTCFWQKVPHRSSLIPSRWFSHNYKIKTKSCRIWPPFLNIKKKRNPYNNQWPC